MSRRRPHWRRKFEKSLFGPGGVAAVPDPEVRQQAKKLLDDLHCNENGERRYLLPGPDSCDLESADTTRDAAAVQRLEASARLLSLLLHPDSDEVAELRLRRRRHQEFAEHVGSPCAGVGDLSFQRLAHAVEDFGCEPECAALLRDRDVPSLLFGLSFGFSSAPGISWYSELRFVVLDGDWVMALYWGDPENSWTAAFPELIGWAGGPDLPGSILELVAYGYQHRSGPDLTEIDFYGPSPPPEPYDRAIELCCTYPGDECPSEGGVNFRASWLAEASLEELPWRVAAADRWHEGQGSAPWHEDADREEEVEAG